VGLELRRAQQLPWLAHFSDPWVDSPYYRRLARAQRARWREQEEAVLREADLIVFTTPQTADLVMRKYPAPWAHKVRVIPHGYDPAPTAAAASDTASTSDCLRLVHTGDLYGERGPLGLFQALRRLVRTGTLPARVELVLVGRSSPEHRQAATELGIEHLVHFHEPQPYADSVRMAAGADVLVVIDAPSNQPSPFLPSKLVDYLMLRKPILGLTPTRGATADLLQRLGCLMAAPDDVPAIARNLVALAAARRDGRLEISPGFERVAREYELAEIARVFDGALAALVASAT
jgi:glycosyltransferase involved in cell wall biosynthesis